MTSGKEVKNNGRRTLLQRTFHENPASQSIDVAPANGIYGASKSALSTYMKYAALELAGKGIRCNAVHPGRIQTPLIENKLLTMEDVAKDIDVYPLKRYGKPEEVAHAIIYLLSDASLWVTGTHLVIDGGRSLK